MARTTATFTIRRKLTQIFVTKEQLFILIAIGQQQRKIYRRINNIVLSRLQNLHNTKTTDAETVRENNVTQKKFV